MNRQRNTKGFTLIELLVVFSVMTILSMIGIVSFIGYGKTQAVTTGTLELANLLTIARSRAQSQVKPSVCSSSALQGYKVVFCKNSVCLKTYPTDPPMIPTQNRTINRSYELQVVCPGGCSGASCLIASRTLPKNVVFDNAFSTIEFSFKIITAEVTNALSSGTLVTITDGSTTKSIRVFKDTRIRVQ